MSEIKTEAIPHVSVVGGGTGSFTLLSELKHFTPNISAIVNMCDDGGSTGKLRDELGVLPPGDVRQCLVALSNQESARDMFTYRFDRQKNGFSEHSLGNLILSGLEKCHGSFDKAIKIAGEILNITGEVVPVTNENQRIVLRDGKRVTKGEHAISTVKNLGRTARLYSEPAVSISEQADKAIRSSDVVVLAPGNVFGSITPICTVEGVPEAFRETRAEVVLVPNLVTKPGHTDNWHVVDFVRHYESYLGKGVFDTVLVNSQNPDRELLEAYAQEGELPVDTSEDRFNKIDARVIKLPLLAGVIFKQDRAVGIAPTLLRHDAHALWRELLVTQPHLQNMPANV